MRIRIPAPPLRILRDWGAPILAGLYLLALTWRSLYFYFTPDDAMNVYQAWHQTAAAMLRANLLFFRPSAYPRPLASAVIRGYYDIAGFHAPGLRALNLALLIANLFLSYAAAWKLTRSRTAAGLTILALAYHPRAKELYFNTGFLFDVLCYFFFFLAVIVYLKAREKGGMPGWRSAAACCLLFICAISCKELAATLPAMLLIYELLYHGFDRWKSPGRWITIAAMGAIDLLWIVGKILAPGSVRDEPGYALTFTAHQFFETSRDLQAQLLLRAAGSVTTLGVIALWAAMLAVALLFAWRGARNARALLFAWLFLLVAPLPIAFTVPRGLPQYYIPLFGWALFASALIEIAYAAALRLVTTAHPARLRFYASTALMLALTCVLYAEWSRSDAEAPATVTLEAEMNRSIVRQVHHLFPVLKPGAKLLFLDDPMRADWWNMTFLMQLSYHDSNLTADRVKRMTAPPDAQQLAGYDHVLDFRGGYFREIRAPWRHEFPPAVAIENGRPQIFHERGIPVTRENPAVTGEVVMVRAIDLKLSSLDIEGTHGGPLPLTRVRVRINNAAAKIRLAMRWPDEPDYSRLDVQIPEGVARGLAWMDITVHGVTGPGVEFAVR